MTDIEAAYKQNAIFQSNLSEEEMMQKLQELNKQYLEESGAYQKNHQNEDPCGIPWYLSVLMFMFAFAPLGRNNEPHTENEERAFLNGKLSAYEKMLNGKIGE